MGGYGWSMDFDTSQDIVAVEDGRVLEHPKNREIKLTDFRSTAEARAHRDYPTPPLTTAACCGGEVLFPLRLWILGVFFTIRFYVQYFDAPSREPLVLNGRRVRSHRISRTELSGTTSYTVEVNHSPLYLSNQTCAPRPAFVSQQVRSSPQGE